MLCVAGHMEVHCDYTWDGPEGSMVGRQKCQKQQLDMPEETWQILSLNLIPQLAFLNVAASMQPRKKYNGWYDSPSVKCAVLVLHTQ
mmetsp:Transcript_53434/g.94996  ORF Transcript_53434/g.94996 Transcript_53434/m.94996 type:complete len:87 (-) Transcript_53434:164-424(-)